MKPAAERKPERAVLDARDRARAPADPFPEATRLEVRRQPRRAREA